MFEYYPLVITNAAAEVVAPAAPALPEEPKDTRRSLWIAAALGLFVVLLFLAQIRLNSYVITRAAAYPAWSSRIPVGLLIWDDKSWHELLSHKFGRCNLAMLGLSVLQSLGLYLLWKSLAGMVVSRTAAICGGLLCLVMLTGAIFVNSVNADVYAYVAYAHLTTAQAYHPVPGMFGGSLAALNELPNHLWFVNRVPNHIWYGLEPAPYGPLWLALAHNTIGLTSNFAAGIYISKAVNAAAFLVCVWSLLALGVNRGLVALFALNPAIIFEAVAEGHNDILAIACIFAGLALAQKRPWLGTVVAGLAGLIKLPYLLISLLVTAAFERPQLRVAAGAAVIAVVAALSYFDGGGAYWYSLVHHVKGNAEPIRQSALHDLMVLASIAAVGAAVLLRRYFAPAAYVFPALFAKIHAWYLIASLPYIARNGGAPFLTFLIVYPMVDLEMSIFFNHSLIGDILFLAIVVSTGLRLRERYRPAAREALT